MSTPTPEQRAAAVADASTLGVRAAAEKHGVSVRSVSRWRARTGQATTPATTPATRKADAPKESPRLGPGGPPAGVTSASRSASRQTHPMIRADVTKVHNALMQSFAGRPAMLQDLYDDMRDRDDRVDAVCRTRLLALQGRPWSVKPPEGHENDPEAQRIAAAVQTIIGRIRAGGEMVVAGNGAGGWRTCLGNIGDAALRGFTVQEIEWGVSREGWKVPLRLHWRAQNRFMFSSELELRKRDTSDPYDGVPLDSWGPNKFVVHSPVAGRPGYPTRRGAMLSMVFLSLAKRSDLRWWLKAIERWASPIPYVTLDADKGKPSDDLQDDTLDMIDNLASEMATFFWGGVELKTIEGSGKLDADAYDKLLERCNTGIAIVALGQNLTTEVKGGSFAATGVHNFVRQDILGGDGAELDDTIRSQLIEPMCGYNWPGAPVPVYETHVEPKQPIPLHLANDFEQDERRASLGYGPRDRDVAAPPPTDDEPDGGAEPDPFAPGRGKTSTSPTSARLATGHAAELLSLSDG